MSDEELVQAHAQYPQADTVEDFARNIAAVRARMTSAAERAGRDPSQVRLLPVSKTVPEDRIRLVVQAGCQTLGENKVQEAKRKHHNLTDLDVSWSVIGHLQTNKAKDVAAFADEFQALDSLRVAEALDRRLEDRKSTRLNSSHVAISYAVFCLKKKTTKQIGRRQTTTT